MANIQSPQQQSSTSTLNPNSIKTFNNQTTGTGLFDVTAGGTDKGDFNELSLLSQTQYATYSNGFNSYPRRTVTGLLQKLMMFIGFFMI